MFVDVVRRAIADHGEHGINGNEAADEEGDAGQSEESQCQRGDEGSNAAGQADQPLALPGKRQAGRRRRAVVLYGL